MARDWYENHPKDTEFRISAATLAEIETGVALIGRSMPEAETRVEQLLHHTERYLVEPIDKHVASTYGAVRAGIVKHFMAKKLSELKQKHRKKLQQWPADWVDQISGKKLGISDMDLWIAATAINKNQMLVSFDTDFSRIQKACPELRQINVADTS